MRQNIPNYLALCNLYIICLRVISDIQEVHSRPPVDAHCDVRLTNTAVYGAQIENLSELRAPDAEAAGHMLDAALTKIHTLNGRSSLVT